MFKTTPLYVQVKEHLASLIDRGEFNTTQRLPSEIELAQKLRVSRNTVRDALLALEREGRLIRRQGLGTFVVSHPVLLQTRIDELPTIPQVIRDNGYEPNMSGLEIRKEAASAYISEKLKIAPGDPVYVVERVYAANDQKAILCRDYLPVQPGYPDIAESDFDGQMLVFLETNYGMRLTHVVATVKAVKAGTRIGGKLGISPDSPLLMFEQVGYSQENPNPIVFTRSYHRSDLISFGVIRQRR